MADQIKLHDPAASLPYGWDWGVPDLKGRTWLDTDTIASADVTSTPAGLTVAAPMHDDTKVSVWVSGGTAGVQYALACHITTTGGRTDTRRMLLICRER